MSEQTQDSRLKTQDSNQLGVKKNRIANKIRKELERDKSFKNDNQGLTLRRYFLSESNTANNLQSYFLECDYSAYENENTNEEFLKELRSNIKACIEVENGIIGRINSESKDSSKSRTVYFRINIKNRHWIGCKFVINDVKNIKVEVFDSSNNRKKDKKILNKLKDQFNNSEEFLQYNKDGQYKKYKMDFEINNNESVICTQTFKNHNNNCVFESEMSMLIDCGIIDNNSDKGSFKDKKRHLNMTKVTKSMDLDTLIKIRYGRDRKNNSKSENFLLDVVQNKDKIEFYKCTNLENNSENIKIIRIGLYNYIVSENKEVCKLELKGNSYIKTKIFKCDDYALECIKNVIKCDLDQSIPKKFKIDKVELKYELPFNKKLNEISESINSEDINLYEADCCTIIGVTNVGKFIIDNNNKAYELELCTDENNRSFYKINKNISFNLKIDLEKLNKKIEIKKIDPTKINEFKYNGTFDDSNKVKFKSNVINKVENNMLSENSIHNPDYTDIDINMLQLTDLNQAVFHKERSNDNNKHNIESISSENSIHNPDYTDIDINMLQLTDLNRAVFHKERSNDNNKYNIESISSENSIHNPDYIIIENDDNKKFINIDEFLTLDKGEQNKYILEHKVRYRDIVNCIAEGKEIKLTKENQERILNHFKKTSKFGKISRANKYIFQNNEKVKKAFSDVINEMEAGKRHSIV